MNVESTPIFDQLTAESAEWSAAASRRARSTDSRWRHSLRADQIECGACPPWRTDPTIPCGYSGVRLVKVSTTQITVSTVTHRASTLTTNTNTTGLFQ